MTGLFDLLNNMKESETSLASAKQFVENEIRTERITKDDIFWDFDEARKLGHDHDIRMDIFNQASDVTMEKIRVFFSENIQDRNYTIMLLGDVDEIDKDMLAEFGQVEYLTLEDVFGY